LPPSAFIPLSSLHDRATRWFDRAHAALLDALPCRRGCSACCHGPFAITVLDAAELQRGLASLDPAVRRGLDERARGQAAAFETAAPRLRASPFLDGWSDAEQDDLAARFGALPCPALDTDGGCLVYASRPVTCRTMGIPTESGGTVEGACPVQTAVPAVRLPAAIREEEDRLAEQEAAALGERHGAVPFAGEEVWLAYGFLADRVPVR
jgi:Fe-S-cluster containining protein